MALRYGKVGDIIPGAFPLRVSEVVVVYKTPFLEMVDVVVVYDDTGEEYSRKTIMNLPDCTAAVWAREIEGTPAFGMVYLYRDGSQRWGWEFPMVRTHEDEPHVGAAIRCLRREVGYNGECTRAHEFLGWQVIDTFPDRVTEETRAVWVEGGDFDFEEREDRRLHEEHFKFIGLDEIQNLIVLGEIKCPVTMAIIHAIKAKLES